MSSSGGIPARSATPWDAQVQQGEIGFFFFRRRLPLLAYRLPIYRAAACGPSFLRVLTNPQADRIRDLSNMKGGNGHINGKASVRWSMISGEGAY